jgi:hypothetical protein
LTISHRKGSEILKFKKKPVVVDAVQYKEGMEDGFKANFVDYGCYTDEELMEKHGLSFDDIKKPYIKTLEGEMTISPGDWIITGIQGERYPCKPDIFEQTYEPVETP